MTWKLEKLITKISRDHVPAKGGPFLSATLVKCSLGLRGSGPCQIVRKKIKVPLRTQVTPNFLQQMRTEVSFPEHSGVMTDARCGDLPGGRSTQLWPQTGSDIILERALGSLENAT